MSFVGPGWEPSPVRGKSLPCGEVGAVEPVAERRRIICCAASPHVVRFSCRLPS